MSMVSSKELAEGIIAQLYQTFGDGYEYHKDELEQDFTAPAFWVHKTSTTHAHIVGRRYFQTHNYDIQFFPAAERSNSTDELDLVADTLTMSMEYIDAGAGKLRAHDVSYQVEDGVLHFFVSYDSWIWKEKERVPYMETLTQIQHTK